jgi:hypothetical protein
VRLVSRFVLHHDAFVVGEPIVRFVATLLFFNRLSGGIYGLTAT